MQLFLKDYQESKFQRTMNKKKTHVQLRIKMVLFLFSPRPKTFMKNWRHCRYENSIHKKSLYSSFVM